MKNPSYGALFPAFSDGLREPDPEFTREAQALDELGVPWRVVNVKGLERRDLALALRHYGEPPAPTVLYRGWILRPAEYRALNGELRRRGAQLLTPRPIGMRCSFRASTSTSRTRPSQPSGAREGQSRERSPRRGGSDPGHISSKTMPNR